MLVVRPPSMDLNQFSLVGIPERSSVPTNRNLEREEQSFAAPMDRAQTVVRRISVDWLTLQAEMDDAIASILKN